MSELEQVYCHAAIEAVLSAYLRLADSTVEEALKTARYGKTDTLGLDGIPEIMISNSLTGFDPSTVLITEEIGLEGISHTSAPTESELFWLTFFISDPTDRSAHLKAYLENAEPSMRIQDIVDRPDAIEKWEAINGAPASITGAFTAITCIRHGLPLCTALVNFITKELTVASKEGVFQLKLPKLTDIDPPKITLDHVIKLGTEIFFKDFARVAAGAADMRCFVTFLGKTGYQENFRDSGLMSEDEQHRYLKYDVPGGPSRPLYLSSLQPTDSPVGFILANGEKIGEWVHWLPFVRFGRRQSNHSQTALTLYEIYQERPWTKEGILMSTPPPYSIFVAHRIPSEGRTTSDWKMLDTGKFRNFPNPSQIRSTLIVAPRTNDWVTVVTRGNLYRRIEFPPL